MAFDFDRVPDRRGTHAMKWDDLAARTGVSAADGLAMWVADMEFPAPPPVLARLRALVDHGVIGYYGPDASWRAAACGWAARRHGWAVDPDWITPSPGVCAAIAFCAQAFAAPGESVVVFAPVYHGFANSVRPTGRRVFEAPLAQVQGRYAMDLDALAATLPPDARMVLLCNPHNPGGTVWTAGELRALAEFCAARELVLISDEIWRDMVFPGARHSVAAMAAPHCADRIVTCVAPSKTFNLAGGQCAEVIIENPALRARYRAAAAGGHALGFNLFGPIAAEAAYAEGDAWLDALVPYLAANRDRFEAGVAEAVPGARPMRLASTYLAWVDFGGTGLDSAEVGRRLRETARIGVNAGAMFGPGGENSARFNLACPRSAVEDALARLADAFADLRA